MNLFKTFSLTWWQATAFKVGLLALGIIIGATWGSFFSRYRLLLGVIAVVSLAYVTYVWARQ